MHHPSENVRMELSAGGFTVLPGDDRASQTELCIGSEYSAFRRSPAFAARKVVMYM